MKRFIMHMPRTRVPHFSTTVLQWPRRLIEYRLSNNFCIKTLCLVLLSFLKLLKLLVYPWTNISINYITNLSKCLYNSKIYRYIFIIINYLIKIRHFISVTSLNIKEFIKVFIYTIYKLYGTLNIIIFNKSSLFIFNF
jgi:hypothetical protein